jgi:fructokinase
VHEAKKYVCCFGEILWDVLPTGKLPGGAPMNVGFHLRNLGADVALISRVGDDDLGKDIKLYTTEKGCSIQWIQTDKKFSTGTVLVNTSDRNEMKYEILHPVAWDFIEANSETIEITKIAAAFVFGSLACRTSKTKETLFSLLKQTDALKICDVNLRTPHFNKELIFELLQRADIVKTNNEELGIINSWFGGEGSLETRSEFIRKKFNLKKIITTLGPEGALLVDESGAHRSRAYPVEVKDTIGSGDAFLAGIIKNLLQNKPNDYMINYASALGALVATQHGANPKISEQEILDLIKNQSSTSN